jgi:YVTN family beta-propeller protein
MMRAGTLFRLLLVGLAGTLVLPVVIGVSALRGAVSNARAGADDPTVIATIPIGWGGRDPEGVAVNPSTNLIYVANEGSDNVSVIDGASNAVVTTVAVGSYPWGVAVNPSTNLIYVANEGSDNVSVIDGASNAVVATVAVGSNPSGVSVNSDTNRIYVANHGSTNVSVIDGASNAVVATVAVGTYPYGVAANPNSNRIYAANYWDETVSVIQDGSGASSDAATFVTQSVNPTVSAGQAFSIFFTIRNSGSSVWSPVGYWLHNINGETLGAPSNQYFSSPISPGQDLTVTIDMTAPSPSSQQTYRTEWMISNMGTTFGPNMFIDVTVLAAPTPTPTPCVTSWDNGISTCDMEVGDVLLIHTTLSPIYVVENRLFGGYWVHAAIYKGDNQIIESTADVQDVWVFAAYDRPGVQTTDIQQSGFWHAEDWAILRPKSDTSNDHKRAAVQWAADQTGKLYNWNYADPNGTDKFYCSQLVWKAYLSQGINIERPWYHIHTIPLAVAPDELYNTSKLNVVAERQGLGQGLKRTLLQVFSPVNLYVTDPLGRHAGADPKTGQTIDEIAGVAYSGAGTEPQVMSIPDMDGSWQVQLVGTGTGSYTFETDTVDPNGPVVTSSNGYTSVGEVHTYTLTYPVQEGDPILVTTPTPTPTPAPTGPPGVGGKVMLPPAAIASESRPFAEDPRWSAGACAALAVGLSAAFAALGIGGWGLSRRRTD